MPDRPHPLLFDLDGTLADTIADIAASTNHVRQIHGLAPHDQATIGGFIGHGAGALLRRALPELGLPAEDPHWPEVYRQYAEHHEDQCAGTVTLYDGVEAGLERWLRAGHAMAIVTNKPERFARRISTHLALDRFFPVIIGGDTLPRRKPDPDPVHRALQLLGATGQGGTMIGDGETDIRAGKAAGLRTIGCLYGYRPAERLRAENADEYWSAFGQIA